MLVIFSCCHFKSLPMILSCLWKVFVLTDKIFLNCLSTVSLSHDIQILSIFPFLVASAFKCYSPLSPQRAIHLKLSRVLFKVIHMSYLRDGIKFYSFYIPIVVAKLCWGRCWVLTDAGLPGVYPWSASASHVGVKYQFT